VVAIDERPEAGLRVLIIVNTRARSGSSDSDLYSFIRVLGAAGCEVVIRFIDGRPVDELLTDAQAFDRVVSVGGDGTVSSVAYALRHTGVPILAYPGGTANMLSTAMGLSVEPRALAHALLESPVQPIDIGELRFGPDGEKRMGFVNVAGAGFDAAIMQSAQPLKAALGHAAYLVAAVQNIAPTVAKFEMDIDGERVSSSGIAVLMVNYGRVTFDLPITKVADPVDGKLELVLLKGRTVPSLLPALLSSVLQRVGQDIDAGQSLEVYRCSRVEVSAYPPLRMQSDGEVLDALTPFAAEVLPSACRFIVDESIRKALQSGTE
jgi:diacylglycerol kinase family enzyme